CSSPPKRTVWQSGVRSSAQLFSSFAHEYPLDAVSIIKLPVYAKWHFVQLLQPCVIVSIPELVENCLYLIVWVAGDKDGVGIPLHWIKIRRSHPVGRRYFNVAAS